MFSARDVLSPERRSPPAAPLRKQRRTLTKPPRQPRAPSSPAPLCEINKRRDEEDKLVSASSTGQQRRWSGQLSLKTGGTQLVFFYHPPFSFFRCLSVSCLSNRPALSGRRHFAARRTETSGYRRDGWTE